MWNALCLAIIGFSIGAIVDRLEKRSRDHSIRLIELEAGRMTCDCDACEEKREREEIPSE